VSVHLDSRVAKHELLLPTSETTILYARMTKPVISGPETAFPVCRAAAESANAVPQGAPRTFPFGPFDASGYPNPRSGPEDCPRSHRASSPMNVLSKRLLSGNAQPRLESRHGILDRPTNGIAAPRGPILTGPAACPTLSPIFRRSSEWSEFFPAGRHVTSTPGGGLKRGPASP